MADKQATRTVSVTKLADEVPNLVGFRISPDVQHPEPTDGALDLETDANFLSLPVHGRRAGKFERSYPPSGGSVRAITFDGQYGFVYNCYLQVTIKRMYGMDVTTHSFNCELEVTLHWMALSSIARQHSEFFDAFKPAICFENAEYQEDLFKDVDVKKEVVMGGPDNKRQNHTHYSVSTSLSTSFFQVFNTHHFPFDLQALCIKFIVSPVQVWGRDFQVELSHPAEHLPGQQPNHILARADFLDDMMIEELVCFRIRNRDTAVCDKYVCNIVVVRNPLAIIMNMLVPCFFVMLLSLLSFWSAPCNIADRASITLTLLLTQTASMQFIQEKLPDVPHMTSVEIVVFASMMLLASQGFMAMRVASLCDNEENNYGMLVDPGINLNPNDQYYTSRAGRCDRYTMIATYCVIVGCLIYIAYLYRRQRLKAKWIREAHKKTFVSAEALKQDSNGDATKLEQLMKKEAELRKEMYDFCEKLHTCKDYGNLLHRDYDHIDTTHLHHFNKSPWAPSGSGKSPPPRAALIFDCGTGATKAILCLLRSEESPVLKVIEPKDAELGESLKDITAPKNQFRHEIQKKFASKNFHKVLNDVFGELYGCELDPRRRTSGVASAAADVIEQAEAAADEGSDDKGTRDPALLRDATKKRDDFIQFLQKEGLVNERTPSMHRLVATLKSDTARTELLRRSENVVPLAVWQSLEVELAEELETSVVSTTVQKNSIYLWMQELVSKFKSGDYFEEMDEPEVKKESRIQYDVVIGVSAWYRNSIGAKEHDSIRKLLEGIQVEQPEWIIERLTDLDECFYEARSAQYAWQRNIKEVGPTVTLGAVLGVGSGSTQFSSSFKKGKDTAGAINEITRDKSTKHLYKVADSGTPDSDLRTQKEEDEDKPELTPFVLQFGNGKGKDCLTKEDRDVKSLQQDWKKMCVASVEQWITDEGLWEHKKWSKEGLSSSHPVLMISGTFYGAVAAGLADKKMKTNLSQVYTAKTVRDKFEEKIKELLDGDELKDGLHEIKGEEPLKAKKKKTTATNLSNFTYLSVLIEKLFDDDTPIYFARDWELPIQNEDTPKNGDKPAPFRTTWTSGFFIDYMRHQGLAL